MAMPIYTTPRKGTPGPGRNAPPDQASSEIAFSRYSVASEQHDTDTREQVERVYIPSGNGVLVGQHMQHAVEPDGHIGNQRHEGRATFATGIDRSLRSLSRRWI